MKEEEAWQAGLVVGYTPMTIAGTLTGGQMSGKPC